MNDEHRKIIGHKGTWYMVGDFYYHGRYFRLYESEQWGDEVPEICLRADGSVVLDDIWNGKDDVVDYLNDNPNMID